MIGTSLYIVFLLYIPSSFEQTCSSQLLKASSKQNFSENFQNNEDFAKMLLIKKCLNNLEGCAKGIPLKNISEEIFRTLPTGMRNTDNLLKWLPCNTVTPIYVVVSKLLRMRNNRNKLSRTNLPTF